VNIVNAFTNGGMTFDELEKKLNEEKEK
jgi:hypothetical protein